ncbi:hypothetical protein ILUMI_01124 [Ignelater luminosus]|uniref:PML C-terminal domain-containing protein n=1 Tax=Ignelater luminosus TaxID=2038154 RepID=A0A8K0GMI2_IGNLU|nr:hypothetical protein ILUMI_01124 [Ignelater luminosus]
MMKQFKKTVVGFADTLTIFKNFLTKRQEEKQSFKVEDLARDFLGPEFTEGLHNAAQDIKILSTLIDKINVPNDKIISMAKSTPFILADRALKKYFKGAVTSVIASKIALGRINLTTLKKAFQLGGYDSVKMLLAENINNKPRVTKNEKTIKAIVDRLGHLLEKGVANETRHQKLLEVDADQCSLGPPHYHFSRQRRGAYGRSLASPSRQEDGGTFMYMGIPVVSQQRVVTMVDKK